MKTYLIIANVSKLCHSVTNRAIVANLPAHSETFKEGKTKHLRLWKLQFRLHLHSKLSLLSVLLHGQASFLVKHLIYGAHDFIRDSVRRFKINMR